MVMKLNKWMSLNGIAGAIAIFSMAGCGASQDHNKDVAADGATSSVSAAITGGVFDGNSVFIVAHRNGTAVPADPCVSDTSGCFNFDTGSNGVPTPVPGDTGAENFNHLCPTADVNESDAAVSDAGGPGTWTFTYHVWSRPNCTGTELTAPGNNFTCFTDSDLASQTFPNQTANETLLPGPVVNTILCVSENTQTLTLIWNPAGTDPPKGGTGNWDQTTANWFDGKKATTWVDGANAVFPAPGGIVTITAVVKPNSLTFMSDGYTVKTNGMNLVLGTGAGVYDIKVTEGTTTISGPVNTRGSPRKTGPGTLVLAGPSQYTSDTYITEGTLAVNTSSEVSMDKITKGPVGTGKVVLLPSLLSASATILIQGTNRLDNPIQVPEFAGKGVPTIAGDGKGFGIYQGAISLSSNPNSPPRLTQVSVPSRSLTIGGNVSGQGGISKIGGGTVSLDPSGTGGNTYKGGTFVNEGTVGVSSRESNRGTMGSGPVTVKNGSTLNAEFPGATIDGEITVQNGGRLRLGLGVLTATNNVLLQPGSVFDVRVAEAGQATELAARKKVTLAGSVLKINLAYAPKRGDQVTIIDEEQANPGQGTFQGLAEGAMVSAQFENTTYNFTITYSGGAKKSSVVLTAK
jgi:autotransporter-associated beta strand protein